MVVRIRADSKFPVDRERIRAAVKRVTDVYGLKQAQVDVQVVGERKMAQLNKQWMKREGPTDVLSFPLEDPSIPFDYTQGKDSGQAAFVMPPGPLWLGDVVVCFPMAVRQAAEKKAK